uniref:Uncharacterized protein n=1 Tax=Rhizophora mucronata TaxID=61149 RepID=A0A2P2MZI5_RHIMU
MLESSEGLRTFLGLPSCLTLAKTSLSEGNNNLPCNSSSSKLSP